MSEQYRLVFSAEVIEGQHAAVVKRRLTAVLKLDAERMDVLFSGKSVVVKKATDEKTAARYQQVFKKAGARLRVLPVETTDDPLSPPTPPTPRMPPADATPAPADTAGPPSATTAGDASATRGLDVLPVGAEVLTNAERADVAAVDVDTSHLSVDAAAAAATQPEPAYDVPNVDHLTLAELGAQLGQTASHEVVVAEIHADFDLAEVGAIIGVLDAPAPAPPVDLEAVDFELAAPGADLGTVQKKAPPPPPDTSHLELDKD